MRGTEGKIEGSSVQPPRELRSAPERTCELADHPQTATHYPTDPHPMSQPVGGPTARQHRTFCARRADPDMRYVPSDVPVERDRMGACSRCLKRFGASWAAPPGAMEGGAAEAAPEAAAEPRGSRRGSRARRQPTAGAQQASNRPTRLELLDDLETRAAREVSCRTC